MAIQFRSIHLIGVAQLIGVVSLWSGCAMPAEAHATTDEPVAQTSSTVTGTGLLAKSYVDLSGTIEIRIYACDAAYGEHPTADCTIPDDDFAVVGGGAEITPQEQNPGALLTGSYPLSTSTWRASSKDHAYVYPHYLWPYVIGMRLSGVSDLRSKIVIRDNGLAQANNSSSVGPGEILVGGGCYATYSGAGWLLHYSIPEPTNPIVGDYQNCLALDHIYSDPSGQTHAVSIGLAQCPDGFGGCLQNGRYEWNGPQGGGYVTSFYSTPLDTGWVMTTVGGYAYIGTSGGAPPRFLATMMPEITYFMGNQGNVFVGSKDHGQASPGWSRAYAFVVARQ